MIIRKRIIDLGGSRYLGLPRDFEVELGERMIVAHNRLMGFASQRITDMTDEVFNAELQAITEMLRVARRVLKTEEPKEQKIAGHRKGGLQG